MWARLVSAVLAAALPVGAPAAVIITVTNPSNTIDGDVSGIAALVANPGPDGISLVEAVAAANNTPGLKEIRFAPALRGTPIPLGWSDSVRAADLLMLTSDGLTIDGDVDGDGTPDITLDGIDRYGNAIDIRASNITINGLIVKVGNQSAIEFACPDLACVERNITGVRITNNHIESGYTDIAFGVWGLLGGDAAPFLSDISYSDIVIEGNSFVATETCIGIRPGVSGAMRNVVRNLVIRNNTFRNSDDQYCINADAADSSTPPYFSDGSLIENLVIDQNAFADCQTAIELLAGNWGNQHAAIRHVQITNNTIAALPDSDSIRMAAAQEPRSRSTSDNVLEDVVIQNNEITGGTRAMRISAGGLVGHSTAPQLLERNTIRDLWIDGNRMHGYTNAGISLAGGHQAEPGDTSTNNLAEAVTIVRNTFEADASSTGAIGVQLYGGEDEGANAKEISHNVVNVAIGGNTFRGNAAAISLIGGIGIATNNRVNVLLIGGNDDQGNGEAIRREDDLFHASGNQVTISVARARPARH